MLLICVSVVFVVYLVVDWRECLCFFSKCLPYLVFCWLLDVWCCSLVIAVLI